jgi:hypothetical protein
LRSSNPLATPSNKGHQAPAASIANDPSLYSRGKASQPLLEQKAERSVSKIYCKPRPSLRSYEPMTIKERWEKLQPKDHILKVETAFMNDDAKKSSPTKLCIAKSLKKPRKRSRRGGETPDCGGNITGRKGRLRWGRRP